MELMRYAPEVVPTEADKVRMYIDGLSAEIRAGYSTITFPTLVAACDAACFVERGRSHLQRFAGRRREREPPAREDRRPFRAQRRDRAGRGGGQVGACAPDRQAAG